MMGKEIRYTRQIGTPLTEEQIARIEAARDFKDEYDEDCPEIDPVKTPELYEALRKATAELLKATAERNRRIERVLREAAG